MKIYIKASQTLDYKGYQIEYNIYGKGEYTVDIDGDDVWCKSLEEAKEVIDGMSNDEEATLDSVDKKLINYLGDRLVAKTDWYDGYCYTFKINNHNVYRVIIFPDELVFQCVKYAINSYGQESYDAQDYKQDRGNKNQWFNLIVQWIDECEKEDPNYTEYLED